MKRSEAIIAKIRRQLPVAAQKSLDHLESLADGRHPGRDDTKETRQDKAARVFLTGFMSAERAKQISETPKVFGLVVTHGMIESPREWEARVAAERDRSAIEAVPMQALAAKEPDAS